ncbi:MAG TPA: DUF2892 domain-containing protein [Planctomycetota bacterium]|nr:DUF2892 domain-containing protein [Planctomycetota bacterium]
MKPAPWSVDRWGRLLAGTATLLFAGLAYLHSPLWLGGCALTGFNQLVSALTDVCPVHAILIRCGAREREELFEPNGALRDPVSLH